MSRYTYRAYYDGTLTKSDPFRSTENDDEVKEALRVLPEHLGHYLGSDAMIEAEAIEMYPMNGQMRPTRCVTIVTAADKATVNDWVGCGLDGLGLYGQQVS